MKSTAFFSLVATVLLVSCAAPPRPVARPTNPPPKVSSEEQSRIPSPPPFGPPAPLPESGEPSLRPITPRHPLEVRTSSQNGIDFTVVSFDRRDHSLKVVDQAGGPGVRFDDAEEAGRSEGGVAAINGGFFSPEGKPVGLVVTRGNRRGYFNSSSYLGSGILDGNTVTLATRQTYRKSSELLQSGPRLVWQGETLTGLSSNNPRPRSLLIWDGNQHFGLVHADSASLKGLSETLKTQPIPGFTIRYALNLDGGTSCDLWVSGNIPGGDFTERSFFRKKARNYLVLTPR